MLKVTLHESKPLRWWYEQFLLGRIDMSPQYQRRGEVWGKWKRAHLIDSILNDFDIPKFYVAHFNSSLPRTLNENETRYAIIDGKQRLGAIFAFFDDKVALNPSITLDDRPDLKIGKSLYSDLARSHPYLVAKIESFEPTVMSVLTDDDQKIKQLFVRLNMGEAATSAERRNAMGGPIPGIVRELSGHPFFTKNIKFSTKRMQEHNLVVKLLMFEFKGELVDTKAKNLDDFTQAAYDWEQAQPDDKTSLDRYGEARDQVLETLELLSTEFNVNDPLLSKAGEIPIYYWVAKRNPRFVNELRDFVLHFTEAVLENMRAQRTEPNSGDPELMAYYTMSRTTNDQGSYEGRLKIFERRFAAFRKGPRR
jgi:hypothetical protein